MLKLLKVQYHSKVLVHLTRFRQGQTAVLGCSFTSVFLVQLRLKPQFHLGFFLQLEKLR